MNSNRKWNGMEIAIIGMAAKFPGANNIDEFWCNLVNGVESITFFTAEELLEKGINSELIKDKNYVKARGILKSPELFDYPFFGYSRRMAEIMDPQSRLLHQCCYSALNDACYIPEDYAGSIGLFIGASSNLQWQAMTLLEQMNQDVALGFESSQLVEKDEFNLRISYNLNLRGPSVFIKTACSTSLTAVHMACRSLLLGECDLALAGGVSMASPTKRGYLYQEGFVKSSDGHCRAFDEKADGFVGGDGVGIVVLKPLQKAIKDKDNIHAIIKGSAINNDGNRRIGYTAPSVEGQTEVLKLAHKISQIDPKTISFIETHGSGTALGDLIEIEAFKNAFKGSGIKKCAIGSVKTNIGHLDAAAGIASLIKVVLSLKSGVIPPTVNFIKSNPQLELETSPFYVNKSTTVYNDCGIRRAGASSLGMGGSNAHIVLEEPIFSNTPNDDWTLLVFSAKTESSLNRYINRFAKNIKEKPENSLYDTAYSLKIGRKAFNHRCIVLGKDAESIISSIENIDERSLNYNYVKARPKLVFMFPGQGGQYPEMGKTLYQKFRMFKDVFNECACHILKSGNIDIVQYILKGGKETEKEIFDTNIAQPLLFSFEYALARLLISWGIKPDMMIGYSFGEYVAACLSGVVSLIEALDIIILRGKLMKKAPEGKMLSIPLPENELQLLLPANITIAIDNIDSCVVSGSNDNISEFEKELKSKRVICFPLELTHAGHSGLMSGIAREFKSELKIIEFKEPGIPYYSNITGLPITKNEVCSINYWCDHLCKTSRFSSGIQDIAKEENVVFIEVGPGRALTSLANRFIKKENDQYSINLCKQESDKNSNIYFLLKGMGLLWLYGENIQWEKFYDDVKGNKISLLPYEFDHYPLPIDKILDTNFLNQREKKFFLKDENSLSFEDKETFFTNQRQFLSNKYIAPENKTEKEICDIWKNVFFHDLIGIEDNFFDLGGDSLKAVAIISKVQSKFSVNISIKEFFSTPTIKHLAFCVENSKKNFIVTVKSNEKRDIYPLSNTEKRMFVMEQFDKTSINYNVPGAKKIRGILDIDKLKKTVKKLIERHEVLRCSYHVLGKGFVKKVSDSVEVGLPVVYVKPDEIDNKIKDFVRPFNLGEAPLFRLQLLKLNDTEYILLTDFHHIILDGYGANIFTKDFVSIYNGDSLVPLNLQYSDYAIWQKNTVNDSFIKDQEKYWLSIYKTTVPNLNLYTDYPRPKVISTEGESLYTYIDNELTESIDALSKVNKSTRFMTMFAAYYVLLYKYTDVTDIVVGASVENRALKNMQNVAGAFVGTVALRSTLNPQSTFNEYLQDVKEIILNAYSNSDYQLDCLLEKIEFQHNSSKNPLFDTMFISAVGKSNGQKLQLEGLQIEKYPIQNQGSKVDLLFELIPEDKKLLLEIQYAIKLYKKETIIKIRDNYFYILRQVCENPNILLSNLKLNNTIEKTQALIPVFDI